MALLEVRDLRTSFRTDDGVVQAVDGVTFAVEKGKTLGIVGESGCGKSVTCLTIMGLNNPRSSTSTGEALLEGENLLAASKSRLRELRGSRIAMIFQDPMTSLNPVKSIGWQLNEAVLLHNDVSKKEARERSVQSLDRGGHPARRAAHRRLSAPVLGWHAAARDDRHGDDQRPGAADRRRADHGARRDDPGADPRAHAQLQEEHGTAIVMITHDLGVVAEIADDVFVMYAGRVAEEGHVDRIYTAPRHPYTWGLLGSLPRVDVETDRLTQIPGQPPSLLRPPPGCRFHPRCPYVMERCLSERAAARGTAERSRAQGRVPPRRGDEGP